MTGLIFSVIVRVREPRGEAPRRMERFCMYTSLGFYGSESYRTRVGRSQSILLANFAEQYICLRVSAHLFMIASNHQLLSLGGGYAGVGLSNPRVRLRFNLYHPGEVYTMKQGVWKLPLSPSRT